MPYRTTYRTSYAIPELTAIAGDVLIFKRGPERQSLWLMRELELSAVEIIRYHAPHLDLLRCPEGLSPLPPATPPPVRRALRLIGSEG